MKRISEFEKDRIDMKQMSKLIGGNATTPTSVVLKTITHNGGCADLITSTTSDTYYNTGILAGQTTLGETTVTVDYAVCPELDPNP